MKQSHKLALAAAVVLAAIGTVSWLTPDGGGSNGLAFADVREEVGRIKSFKYTYMRAREGDKPTATEVMYLAPGRGRIVRPDGTILIVDYVNWKSLKLRPDKKEAHLYDSALNLSSAISRVNILETIERIADGTEEVLGERLLGGRRTICFVFHGGNTDWTVWADPETRRPVRVECMGIGDWGWLKWVMKDFVYNVDLDESLFSLELPKGYAAAKKGMTVGTIILPERGDPSRE